MPPRRKKLKRSIPTPPPEPQILEKPLNLILTSEKRRGFYECDYCRTDLSQAPRICCAICPEFDLCLECFINPKASDAASAKQLSSTDSMRHDHTHGYRVCDSTRFFMFPSLRGVEEVGHELRSHRNSVTLSDVTKLSESQEGKETCNISADQHVPQNSKNAALEEAVCDSVKDTFSSNEEEQSPLEEHVQGRQGDTMEQEIGESDKGNEVQPDSIPQHDTVLQKDSVAQLSQDTASRGDGDAETKDSSANSKSVVDAVSQVPESNQESDKVCTKEILESADVTKKVLDEKSLEEENDQKDMNTDTSSSKDNEDIASNVASISNNVHSGTISTDYVVTDDIKNMWTVEEDLRLLDAISHLGLGNWIDIAEEVAGANCTNNKTPKRCMERYLYDYLGKYGHILPQYTLVEAKENDIPNATGANTTMNSNQEKLEKSNFINDCNPLSQRSNLFQGNGDKLYSVVPTCTLPNYDKVWKNPYVPPIGSIKLGDDVGRDFAVKAEQTYMKLMSGAANQSEADTIREEWEKNRLNKHGGPTVLPPRPEDMNSMQGSALAGYMPRRGDFDIEWDNDAEKFLQDMEFSQNDTVEEKELKIKVIKIYNARLDEREKRKQFLIDRGLLDYRKRFQEDNKLPSDERDLKNRMRLFARFQSPQEHEELVENLLKAKRLRKEIARFQMYRRMGFTSMLEAEKFELDRNRREAHRLACEQREKEEKAAAAKEQGSNVPLTTSDISKSYVKQYRQKESRHRRHSRENDATKFSDNNHVNTVVECDVETQSSQRSEEKVSDDTCNTTTTAAATTTTQFDVRKHPGHETLSKKEIELCQRVHLTPKLFHETKNTLIQAALEHGMLEDEKSNRASVFKVDVQKRGDVIDFMLQSSSLPELPHGTQKK